RTCTGDFESHLWGEPPVAEPLAVLPPFLQREEDGLQSRSIAAGNTKFHLETLLRPPHPDAVRLNAANNPVVIGDGASRYLCGACGLTLVVGVGGRHQIIARAAEVIARCYECRADNIVSFVFG
ncbi:MAG: hypothetical protein M3N13_07630, partial [Candidatus Eremiobacteraeota bacterium]|nr:hypothetical protein [Candidatus Eremiobacteraeota bacterium]